MTSQNAMYAAFITCRNDFTISETAVWLVFSAMLFMAVGLTVATV